MAVEPIFAEERQNRILSMLKASNKLLVNELCAVFSVSPATIRNDLNQLESKGLLKRTHGGAICIVKTGFEQTSAQKAHINAEEKQRIARCAADFVENGDTIAIDTGTTMYYLAQSLVDKSDITVVTTDIRIATLLEGCENISIFLAGGMLRKGFSCTIGAVANSALSSLSVDKAFLATNAVGMTGELCTPDIEQAQIKQQLLKMGKQSFLLCDSTKFGSHSFARFGSLSDIDTVITDDRIDADLLRQLGAQGVDVKTV